MKSFLVALAIAALLVMTSALAFAAPQGPKDDRHGPPSVTPVAQADQQDATATPTAEPNEQHESASPAADANRHDPTGDSNAKNKQNGDQADHGAASLSKRHGAAGVVHVWTTDGFELTTKQGSVQVIVDPKTKFSIQAKHNATVDQFKAAVTLDQTRVNVNGTSGTDSSGAPTLTAKLVHVIPTKAAFEHVVGMVTAYTAGTSITLERGQKTLTFTVSSSTKIEPSGSAPKVGDWVTVVVDKTASTPTASGIAIFPHKKDKE